MTTTTAECIMAGTGELCIDTCPVKCWEKEIKIRFLEDENRKLRAQNAVKGIPEIRIVV